MFRARGVTLLELAVSLALVSALLGVLFNRLTFYQEKAEQATMEYTLQAIKTGLQIRLAELIATNRQHLALQLEVENPTQWLSKMPTGYAGDYPASPQPGAWYYDALRRQLVYVPRNNHHLAVAEIDGVEQLRFEVKLIKYQGIINGARVSSVNGVRLEAAYPYNWR